MTNLKNYFVLDMEPEHYHGMNIRQEDKITLVGIEDIEALLEVYQRAGPCKSLFVNGKIIAMIGAVMVWRGVYEIWMLTTPDVEKHAVFFHKSILRLESDYLKTTKCHRVQCVVHEANLRSKKWVEHLGFEFEGLMKHYGENGAHYLRYAKTWRPQ